MTMQEATPRSNILMAPGRPPADEGRRQELAEIGIPGEEIELKGDDKLFQALVSGCHVENAAVIAGISERTAYRRLADPEFRSRLNQARESLRESILAKLADAGHDAIGVLTDLMHTAEDEATRLKAAKTVLDSLANFHSKRQPPESEPQNSHGSVMLILPDNGRDEDLTEKVRESGGKLLI